MTNLEKSIKQKEDIIKEVNDSLKKEKELRLNFSENLNKEKEKNKILENKYSDVEKKGELNLKQNEELQSQLKIKNDELEIAKKMEISV